MLRPAAVSAAATAVCLLAVLGPGLSLPAEDNSEAGFTLCSHCFYRQTPPRGPSAGPLLHPLCHRLPGGQEFATLYKPTCDTAVYSAFHLSHGWTERQGQEGEELLAEEEENIKVAIPALLRGGEELSHPASPADSPLQRWDATVTTLVQSSIIPHCSTVGGDLYILSGVGRLGATEDGGEECQTELLWSAVCCTVPGGKGGFSVGLISETDEGEKQVTVEELEEKLGVAELFSEGCAGADGATFVVSAGPKDVYSDIIQDNVRDEEGLDSSAEAREGKVEPIAGEQVVNHDVQPDEADVTRGAAGTSESSVEERGDVTPSGAVRSEPFESTDDEETVEEDTNSSGAVAYILSTIFSILTSPLRPVASRITQLPGQVTYVLQEHLGVLSALPGETFSLLHLLTSDMLSWMVFAGEMLLVIGETCFFGVYYCTSSMLGALLGSCQTGVTGMGTLAGDTVGIFGDTLDNAWWVTKIFGGRLWEHSEGYVGTVVTELGGQAKAVGGGLGRLAWRSGNGVGNVISMGAGLIMGTVDLVFGAVGDSFGQKSD